MQLDPMDWLNVTTVAAYLLGAAVGGLAGDGLYDRLILPAWGLAELALLIAGIVTGHNAWTGFNGGAAAMAAWYWGRKRRKRKRSAKLIGAKSRALLAAVVARMRETLKPRPGLIPAPGRAG